MLMTVVHENHIYAVVPLLSLIWWRDRSLRWLYLAISVVFLVNLLLHDASIYELLQRLGLHYWHIGVTLANAVVYLAILLWWTMRLAGAPMRRMTRLLVPATGLAAAVAFVFSPSLVSASYDPARIGTPSGAMFGDQIRLVGSSVTPQRVQPGETVHTAFTWQPTADLSEHYMLFVHLVNAKQEKAGQQDGPPTRNLYPTRLWRAGEAIHDERAVPIRRDAKPGVYDVQIGFYPVTNFERLPATVDGRIDNQLTIGRIVVTGPPPAAPASRLDRALGDSIVLEGFSAPSLAVRSGEPLTFDLVWRATGAPTTDYTIFAQLLDPAGGLAGQFDGQPHGGRYPTTAWTSGDRIADNVSLAPARPGKYQLIVGMYDLRNGARLAAGGEGYVDLGAVEVRP
jgi:hypothetical protein